VILVDSSVLIDFLGGNAGPETELFEQAAAQDQVVIGDLILCEVLQGIRHDRDHAAAREGLLQFSIVEIGGVDCALAAADNYRQLRGRGVTVRKTIDGLIATRCLMNGYRLLAHDRDFEPFHRFLGLQRALPMPA
jgi:predicted nucleic acid-binding protein